MEQKDNCDCVYDNNVGMWLQGNTHMCPYGNLMCEYPHTMNTCVWCEFGPDVFDAWCPSCDKEREEGRASGWHRYISDNTSQCVRCGLIHENTQGVLL